LQVSTGWRSRRPRAEVTACHACGARAMALARVAAGASKKNDD
jgi:hypothetical protein